MAEQRKPILLIGNLTSTSNSQHLKQVLSKFGNILTLVFERDGTHLQSGTVVFEKIEHAENVMQCVLHHPIIYQGKELVFHWLQARKPTLSIYNVGLMCNEDNLKQECSKFGSIVNLNFDRDSYGWVSAVTVEFQFMEDAETLMNSITKHHIHFEGKKLHFVWFNKY